MRMYTAAGVQQAHKEDKIAFASLVPWPGTYICAEGRYSRAGSVSDGAVKRAAIFIGPEFGTVQRQDLVLAAREAGDADFDVLIACALNYEAHTTEFSKLGRIPVLKARMNADLHISETLTMARLLVSKSDAEFFGKTEFDVRDRSHTIGACAIETALAERKKGVRRVEHDLPALRRIGPLRELSVQDLHQFRRRDSLRARLLPLRGMRPGPLSHRCGAAAVAGADDAGRPGMSRSQTTRCHHRPTPQIPIQAEPIQTLPCKRAGGEVLVAVF